MKLSYALSLLFFPLLLGAADQQWKFTEQPYRVKLDWNSASGRACEIALDAKKLSQLVKQDSPADPNSLRVAALTNGKSEEIPITVMTRPSNSLRVYFVLPENATGAELYFGGKSTTSPTGATVTNLLTGALDAKKWINPQGKCAVTSEGDVLQLSSKSSTLVRKDFPIPDGITPGAPVILDYAIKSPSAYAWNLSIRTRQLDANGKELPSSATDPRWSTQYLPINGSMENCVVGHLDARAKTIRVQLKCEVPELKTDLYGKPFSDTDQNQMKAEISRLELRVAQLIPFPGHNPDFFTDGVDGGKAFHLTGTNAPFFNNNPMAVWAEGNKKIIDQADYHFSKGDSTFEAWIKPELDSSKAEYTIVEAYQDSRKKSPIALTYNSGKKEWKLTVNDFGGHSKTLTATAELPNGEWSHVATCGSEKNGLALFLNGKKIASDPSFAYQAANLETAERSDEIMPDNISLGVARGPVRAASLKKAVFLKGAIDKVRFSTVARYTEDFTPSKKIECDADTCAFFDYEGTYDGIHGAGDGYIDGSILAKDSPYANQITLEVCKNQKIASGKVQVYPDDIVPENHPRNTLPVTNYPKLPEAKDFNSIRETREKTFTIQSGSKFNLDINEPTYMNWVEIACPENGKPLEAPIVINKGDLDVRSYGDLRDTMFPADQPPMSNHQRANYLFSFLIHASDYFMSHQAKISDQNTVVMAEYGGLAQIAGYCGFECGPLNSLAMNTFVNVLGNPACMTFGNAHLFEQQFFDGRWRVYDLSAQSYFPSRRQDDAASLGEIEEDAHLLSRFKDTSASHFYRLCARITYGGGILPAKKLTYTLNPGESFRIYWHNNGVYNDLQVALSKVVARLQKGQGVDVLQEIGATPSRRKESVLQVDRPFPHYSNAYLSFNGTVSAGNPAFTKVSEDSFTYQVMLPYPIVSANYKAEGSNISYELSYDGGGTWRQVPAGADGVCHLGLEVRARNNYLLRVNGQRTGKFQAETIVQMNTRVLTGALHQGKNELVFKSDSPGSAKVTFSYRVDTNKELKFDGVNSWGAIPGEEKQMVIMIPSEACEIGVEGLSSKATVRGTQGIEAKLNGSKIQLLTSDKTPRLASLVIQDGKNEKRLVVAVMPEGARWIPAEKMNIGAGAELQEPDSTRTMRVVKSTGDKADITYKFAPINAGKYLIFHLERNAPLSEDAVWIPLWLMKNGKTSLPLVRRTNNSAEFYKAEKLLWRFRWDYPISGKYPFEMMTPQELPACDSLTVRCTAPNIEIAGVLIVPADDLEFMKVFRKYCCGFNYQPQMFDSELNTAPSAKR